MLLDASTESRRTLRVETATRMHFSHVFQEVSDALSVSFMVSPEQELLVSLA